MRRALLLVLLLPLLGLALVTCSDDGSLRFWNVADGLEVRPALRTPQRGDTPILTVCIDIRNPLELHCWAKSLGATREEIRNAVAEVGPFIDRVIEHLSRI